jgi:crossover junction endodeoxyribonuclease RusA
MTREHTNVRLLPPIRIEGSLLTLNRERTQHWSKRAEHTSRWRHLAMVTARNAHIGQHTRIMLAVQPVQARGPLADIGAHWPTVKAAIDGLVDAQVIPDDTPTHLVDVDMRPPIRPSADLGWSSAHHRVRGTGLIITIGVVD